MIIDLSKLIYGQTDRIDIDTEVTIPSEYLINSEIKDISKVKVNGEIVEEG